MGEAAEPIAQQKHGPHLAGRAARDVDEAEQFFCGAAIEALHHVIGHGKRCSLQLVGQIAEAPEPRSCVSANTRSVRSIPACQTGSSSNRLYVMSMAPCCAPCTGSACLSHRARLCAVRLSAASDIAFHWHSQPCLKSPKRPRRPLVWKQAPHISNLKFQI